MCDGNEESPSFVNSWENLNALMQLICGLCGVCSDKSQVFRTRVWQGRCLYASDIAHHDLVRHGRAVLNSPSSARKSPSEFQHKGCGIPRFDGFFSGEFLSSPSAIMGKNRSVNPDTPTSKDDSSG